MFAVIDKARTLRVLGPHGTLSGPVTILVRAAARLFREPHLRTGLLTVRSTESPRELILFTRLVHLLWREIHFLEGWPNSYKISVGSHKRNLSVDFLFLASLLNMD